MQCLITVITDAEKLTLCKLLTDGWTDANLNSYVTPCLKKPHPATSKCAKHNKIV